MIETKKKIAILTVAVAALALTALISTVSAYAPVQLGNNTITFVGKTFEGTNTIWTYSVTSSSSPALSHWVLGWCNKDAIVEVSDIKWEYGTDPHTGIRGIKFETGYADGENRIVWFKLSGDYVIDLVEVGTKSGKEEIDTGIIEGPVYSACPPVPELPTIILLGAGLLTLAGYVGLRRKKK